MDNAKLTHEDYDSSMSRFCSCCEAFPDLLGKNQKYQAQGTIKSAITCHKTIKEFFYQTIEDFPYGNSEDCIEANMIYDRMMNMIRDMVAKFREVYYANSERGVRYHG